MWRIEYKTKNGDNVMWVPFFVNPGWFQDISEKHVEYY